MTISIAAASHAAFMARPVNARYKNSQHVRSRFDTAVVPIIVTPSSASSPPLTHRFKFIMRDEEPIQMLCAKLRIHMVADGGAVPNTALFLFVTPPPGDTDHDAKAGGAVMAAGSTSAGTLYEAYSHSDGFLHITYTTESTFGGRQQKKRRKTPVALPCTALTLQGVPCRNKRSKGGTCCAQHTTAATYVAARRFAFKHGG
jgi:hypothetical protein